MRLQTRRHFRASHRCRFVRENFSMPSRVSGTSLQKVFCFYFSASAPMQPRTIRIVCGIAAAVVFVLYAALLRVPEKIDHMRATEFIRGEFNFDLLVADKVDDILPMLQKAEETVPESAKKMPAAVVDKL